MNTNNGWKLVPVVPTDEMEVAAENDYEQTGATFPRWKSAYAAMMNAAPAAPTSHPIPTGATGEDERKPDLCPRCDGSGEVTVLSDNSPDAHDVNMPCDHCQGSGAAVDAAKYLAAALSGEKYRHMQLWAEYRNFHRSLCARFGYGHDPAHFRRDLVSLEEAIAAKVNAPAAGDALELKRKTDLIGELSKIIHNMTVAQQAAWIEWRHGAGADAAMQWIENGLAGPGHVPDEDEPYGTEAQAYFDANQADPFPACHCGRPSNILHMGSGYCSDEHYRAAVAQQSQRKEGT